jgi:hypothetical protein
VRPAACCLQRDADTVVIQPNTKTGLAGARDGSRRISVQHRAGSILLDINRGKSSRVRVRTHQLTAVVKGTRFTVTASRGRSSVAVERGLVQVRDNRSGQIANVGAGRSVSSTGKGGLSGSGASGSSSSAVISVVSVIPRYCQLFSACRISTCLWCQPWRVCHCQFARPRPHAGRRRWQRRRQ